ncbi:MAG: peroxiredoxin [Myxococcaceae bacterium]|nr:peroxiredoxin [Myxococcaceae bacterium]
MVSVGDIAPDFSATDCAGREFKLSDFRGKKVVLFFFPRAFTPACTIEIRAFRDNQALIESKGAVLVGVSVDNHTRQCDFAKSESIDFHLIGDEHRTISEKYGVVWPVLKIDRRATFIIDEHGLVEDVLHHEVQVYKHLDDVLVKLGAVPV